MFESDADLRRSELGTNSFVFADTTDAIPDVSVAELPVVTVRAEWFEYTATAGHLVYYNDEGVEVVFWGGTRAQSRGIWMNDSLRSDAASGRSQEPTHPGANGRTLQIVSHVLGLLSLIWALIAWAEWFTIPFLYAHDGSPVHYLGFALQAIIHPQALHEPATG